MSVMSLQRTRLLDNTERTERSGRRLEQGYKTVLETGESHLKWGENAVTVHVKVGTERCHSSC